MACLSSALLLPLISIHCPLIFYDVFSQGAAPTKILTNQVNRLNIQCNKSLVVSKVTLELQQAT